MTKSKDISNTFVSNISNLDMDDFIKTIPKAELHVHIEGTLEPETMFRLLKRNKVTLKYSSIEELKSAYNFSNLKSFLDVYYEGAKVLIKEEDFYELTWEYLKKVSSQNVLHAEIFFDPQAHTTRGIAIETVISGITKALNDGKEKLGVSSFLIMCFLRHLSVKSAMEILDKSLPFKEQITGVGLDSTELGNPPSKFTEVFRRAKSLGYKLVAHAGEEGPPEYIWQAINDLKVSRIDHGVRCLEDPTLVKELAERKIPLTVCPFSNIKLGVFKSLKEHNLRKLTNEGLIVIINSDDPAYFGGYVNENLIAVQRALELTKEEVYQLAKNSFIASFASSSKKEEFVSKLKNYQSYACH